MQMRKSLLLAALVLAGCSQLPAPEQVSPDQINDNQVAQQDMLEDVVPDSEDDHHIGLKEGP